MLQVFFHSSVVMNIELPPTSFFEHRIRTSNSNTRPYFLLQTNKHKTSKFVEPIISLLNYSSDRLEHHIFEHQTNSNLFMFW